jgi:hypothetical protein
MATNEGPAPRGSTRVAAGIIGLFDAVAWLLIVGYYAWSDSDPATAGFDKAAAAVTTVLFALTGAPALGLAMRDRALHIAVLLALAFPTILVALLITVILAFY